MRPYRLLILAIGLLLLSASCSQEDDIVDPGSNTVTDIDGNVYKTVTICSKVWMAENLKVTRYNDGMAIPLVENMAGWDLLTSPAYCWYDNDPDTYKAPYGALYNWFAVNTGKLAPEGWHVPTIIEWDEMITCFGGDSAAADKLKETGTTHWMDPNIGGTNEYGFTALPAGVRSNQGAFMGLRTTTYWWTASGNLPSSAWYISIYYLHSYPNLSICNPQQGFSVRCVKNDPVGLERQ